MTTPKKRTWGATLTKPPRKPAGKRSKWVGEWELLQISVYDGVAERRGLAWVREWLELNGHEECCQMTWPVYVEVGEWTEKLRTSDECA
jgi:hypothetical protein